MKKFIFLLVLVTFQISYAQWEKTGWKSSFPIRKFWVQDSVIVINNAYNADSSEMISGLTISIDNGKTFPIVSSLPKEFPPPKYENDIVDFAIVGKSIFIGSSGSIWRSDDWGSTWQKKETGLYKHGLVNKLFAVENQIFLGTTHGLFKSTDNGETWQNLKNGIDSNSTVLNIARFKSNLVITIEIKGINQSYGVYISSDNGESWVSRSKGITSPSKLRTILNIEDTLIVVDDPDESYIYILFSRRRKIMEELSEYGCKFVIY